MHYLQILANEIVLYWIIMTTNLGEENAIGLIINFSSAIIISEIDDFVTKLGRVQAMREDYEKMMGEGKEQIMKKKAKKRVV